MSRRPSIAALALAAVLAAVPAASLAQEPVIVTDAEGNEVAITDTSRIATLGGVATEITYALGAQDQVIAVDDSSFYPPEALADKPSVGYHRFLAAEPVIAAGPTLILGDDESGPPDVLAQLRDAGITILLLPDPTSVEEATELIGSVGRALGREEAADEVTDKLEADLAAAESLVAGVTEAPRVLFYFRPPGAPSMIAGAETAAGAMIELAGGENVYPGFDGYLPMTPEGLVEIAPDVILTTDQSLREVGGLEGLLAEPGIAETPAAADGRIVSMEDLYLLGFGPRTGQAVADLARLIHPELGS
jgi:iron complex transport system substrate-binding protein